MAGEACKGCSPLPCNDPIHTAINIAGEVGRQVQYQPFDNWNCVTKLLLTLSQVQVWSAPPARCPVPCQLLSTCSECLQADGGGSGGPARCYWSVPYNQVGAREDTYHPLHVEIILQDRTNPCENYVGKLANQKERTQPS